tara:strand:- start:39 stop:170 length:132 start_codon:yes stop_codon:yes gene_type:complete
MKAICEFSKYKNKVYGSGKIAPKKEEETIKKIFKQAELIDLAA